MYASMYRTVIQIETSQCRNVGYIENNKQATKTEPISMIEIGNANETKANATRGNVYAIHTNEYVEIRSK